MSTSARRKAWPASIAFSGESISPILQTSTRGGCFSIAFLYALENVLQEYLIKKKEDVFNFLGFIGLFGVLITLAEATITWEFT